MMLQPRANEIREIILALGSRSAARVDAARARLSIIGARAVEDLIEALEGGGPRVRARVMPLLALIQDPRGREPLIAMLLDRNAELREIAARSLARFPSAEVVAALNRALQREPRVEVRLAVVGALVEHYAAGQEQAVRRVVELLLDPEQEPAVRLAAFGLLPLLGRSERERLCERLAEDPRAEIRQQVARFVEQCAVAADGGTEHIQELIARLGASDYAMWNDAVHRLGASGPRVVRPLVAAMQSRAHDAEYCARAGMALKALGPRRGRKLVELLDEVDEAQPLQVLVEVVGALGENALIYRLKDLIERLARRESGAERPDPLRRARAKAHLELARIGSRVAVEDLRTLLGSSASRVDIEALAAVETIGKRDELGVLLLAWSREDSFMRERIADVVRSIMRRERIRRNDRAFQALGPEQRRALEAILPPPAPRSRRPAAAPEAR